MDSSGERVRTSRLFRCTVAGDGRPGPIEERIGRRLVRLVPPESDEGLALIDDGRIDWIGPDGNRLGRIDSRQAYRRLRERLEHRLSESSAPGPREDLEEGLTRLQSWSARILRQDH